MYSPGASSATAWETEPGAARAAATNVTSANASSSGIAMSSSTGAVEPSLRRTMSSSWTSSPSLVSENTAGPAGSSSGMPPNVYSVASTSTAVKPQLVVR